MTDRQPVPGVHENFAASGGVRGTPPTREVTKEMIEAVAWSASTHPGKPFGMILTDNDVQNILSIGIANCPPPQTQLRVKQLRWKGPDGSGEYHSLDGLWGYIIRPSKDNFWLTEVGREFGSPEIAMQYAQANYQGRILAALTTDGQS